MENPVVILLSGGPDSSTLAYDLVKRQGKKVLAITFDFGEREANAEIAAAKKVAMDLGIEHHIVDFSAPMRELYGLPFPQYLRKAAGPILTSEHAPDQSKDVQPFGSAIALLMAASWALKQGASSVYYGVHFNDTVYKDNNSSYFELLEKVTSSCEGESYAVQFKTPYLELMKSDVVALGHSLGLPLGDTWSCAASDETHCGQCDPCVDRIEAFKQSGIEDSTEYAMDLSATAK